MAWPHAAIVTTGLVLISWIVARWRGGRHRHLRLTLVIERDYEAPDPPGRGKTEDGVSRED